MKQFERERIFDLSVGKTYNLVKDNFFSGGRLQFYKAPLKDELDKLKNIYNAQKETNSLIIADKKYISEEFVTAKDNNYSSLGSPEIFVTCLSDPQEIVIVECSPYCGIQSNNGIVYSNYISSRFFAEQKDKKVHIIDVVNKLAEKPFNKFKIFFTFYVLYVVYVKIIIVDKNNNYVGYLLHFLSNGANVDNKVLNVKAVRYDSSEEKDMYYVFRGEVEGYNLVEFIGNSELKYNQLYKNIYMKSRSYFENISNIFQSNIFHPYIIKKS
ncbi:MAG: hypothetical protein QXO21_00145 [Candidatus Anstonellales archaeon]